jgi:hypothetical protein
VESLVYKLILSKILSMSSINKCYKDHSLQIYIKQDFVVEEVFTNFMEILVYKLALRRFCQRASIHKCYGDPSLQIDIEQDFVVEQVFTNFVEILVYKLILSKILSMSRYSQMLWRSQSTNRYLARFFLLSRYSQMLCRSPVYKSILSKILSMGMCLQTLQFLQVKILQSDIEQDFVHEQVFTTSAQFFIFTYK